MCVGIVSIPATENWPAEAMVSKVYCNSLISFFVVVLGYAFIILGLSLLHWLMTRKLHGTKERKITTPMASYLTENRMQKKKKNNHFPRLHIVSGPWMHFSPCLLQPSPLFFCSDHSHDSFSPHPLSNFPSILPSQSPEICSARTPSHRLLCSLLPPSLPPSLCPAEEHLSISLK